MPSSTARKIKFPTIADVQKRLGNIPEYRILSFPAPGTATLQDLLDNSVTNGRPCELVDGILVEKAMGLRSDYIGAWILHLIATFLDQNNLGAVFGSQGPVRLKLNLVRLPDVFFIRWDSVDDTDEIENPVGACLETPPDLVVEVLSPGNTPKEMETKLQEYARAGVELVWYVDPERDEVDVYPKGNAKRMKTLGADGTLDGGEILPGFTLPVSKIFQSRAPAKKPGKRRKK
jgi:Uma2 family endonuclease